MVTKSSIKHESTEWKLTTYKYCHSWLFDLELLLERLFHCTSPCIRSLFTKFQVKWNTAYNTGPQRQSHGLWVGASLDHSCSGTCSHRGSVGLGSGEFGQVDPLTSFVMFSQYWAGFMVSQNPCASLFTVNGEWCCHGGVCTSVWLGGLCQVASTWMPGPRVS